MIGDKRLDMPKVGWDCKEIYDYFGLKGVKVMSDEFFPNAERLVELNNEVYDKLQIAVEELVHLYEKQGLQSTHDTLEKLLGKDKAEKISQDIYGSEAE
ncbi:MAG: hypothetical protein ABFD25_03365 [Clostridiaceae bacterium]